jgi:hypothetical protein
MVQNGRRMGAEWEENGARYAIRKELLKEF